MERSNSVQEYIENHNQWGKELNKLINIAHKTEFQETIKWGVPTYTINNKNVMGIAAFKSYVVIWFFNGSFLKDDARVLVNAQEEKTKGLRQWRFSSLIEINNNERLITAYMHEALENQKAGKVLKKAKAKPLVIPKELQEVFQTNRKLKTLFDGFSNYKQKEFAEYIESAKRESTKLKRLDKIIPMILSGEGLNDKYARK